SGGTPVDWDRALDDAGRALSAVLSKSPNQVGVVFNAQSTNEDLYALARLAFDHLHVGKAYIAGLDQGWHDDILVSADKNPNTAGAMAIGAGRLRSLLDLSNDIKAGALTTLLVVGTHGVLAADAPSPLPLDKLKTLVVIGTHRGHLTEGARVAMPLCEWAE